MSIKKTALLLILLFAGVGVEARTINVTDHGIVPGKDVTYELNRLIETVQGEAGVTLSFPEGQYDFHAENALEMHRAVSNHDNGLKRMVFPLFKHKDITIDGNGSLFMMHGRVVPFTIESVDGITLKNFSIDWIRPFHAEMKVVQRDVSKNMGKVLIENNSFSSQMNGILIEGDNNKWYESGAVEDVVIRNNVFENIGFGLQKHYPLYAAPLLNKTQRIGEGHYHRNITFAHNTIKTFNGHVVFSLSVDGLKIENNTIEFSTDYPEAHLGEAVELSYCNNVSIRNNTAKGFSKPLNIKPTHDVTNLEVVKNRNLTLED